MDIDPPRQTEAGAPPRQTEAGAATGTGACREDAAASRGNSRKSLSIIYGTAWKRGQTSQLVVQALRAGFSAFDTGAQPKHYDEHLVGDALAQEGTPRASVFLQTKFTPVQWQDRTRLPYDPDETIETQVNQSIASSLLNLRTTYVDSLLLHGLLESDATTLRAWRAMEAEVDAGRALSLGISNVPDAASLSRLHAAARVKPAWVQNGFWQRSGFDVELRSYCRAASITYQGYRLLPLPAEDSRASLLAPIADEHGISVEQAWLAAARALDVVLLTGTTRHMAENLVGSQTLLSGEEAGRIRLGLQAR